MRTGQARKRLKSASDSQRSGDLCHCFRSLAVAINNVNNPATAYAPKEELMADRIIKMLFTLRKKNSSRWFYNGEHNVHSSGEHPYGSRDQAKLQSCWRRVTLRAGAINLSSFLACCCSDLITAPLCILHEEFILLQAADMLRPKVSQSDFQPTLLSPKMRGGKLREDGTIGTNGYRAEG